MSDSKPFADTRLIYVMDPMCSWCWGFEPVIQQLRQLAETFQVPSIMRVGGLRSDQAPLSSAKREYILEHWRTVAERTQQPFNFTNAMPDGFIYNSEPACRALVTAQQLDTERAWVFLSQLQLAFYQQQANLSNPQTLSQLAKQSGFDQSAFTALLHSADMQQRTQQDFAWVQSLPIRGFPSVLISHQQQLQLITNGYQDADSLIPQLQNWLEAHC